MSVIDTNNLLESDADARLIAEDEKSIVLAIRIDKQLLQDNFALLASAMEAALDRRKKSRCLT